MLPYKRFPAARAVVWITAVLVLAGVACSGGPRISLDPEEIPVFEKTRLVMTDEEAKMYRSIPDRRARDEFIIDFWKMRDPDPQTPENEAKTEFEKRAEFANKWFSRFDPIRGRDVEGKTHPQDGCLSGRGWVYILFGPPDRMTMTAADLSEGDVRIPFFRKISDENEFVGEIWHYDRPRLSVFFSKTDTGRWELDPSSRVADRLERMKIALLEGHYDGVATKPLTFLARYQNRTFRLEIPAGRLSLDADRKVEIGISVNVYREGVKTGELKEAKTIDRSAEGWSESGAAAIEIPYDPGVKGRYLFEIKLDDLKANRFSRARALISQKIR